MTTRTEPLPLSRADTRGFPWGRLLFSFLLTLAAFALFVAAFAVGYTRLHEGKVVSGVEVGGVALAGLDRAAAEARLRESLPALSSGQLSVSFGDVQDRISYAEIGRDYDIALMLDQAFSVGRGANVFDQAAEQLRVLMHGVSVEPSMSWNSEALTERVAALGATVLADPVDATIEREGGRYTVTPSTDGRTVDIEEGVRLANVAVNSLSADDTAIAVQPVAVPPQVTTAQAQAAVDRLERVAATDLVLTGGDSSTRIPADAIRGWLRLEEVGVGQWVIAIKDDPIRQLVAQHAAEVDLPAQNATFRFEGENVVAVPGQTGRTVDVEASSSTVLTTLEARASGGDGGGGEVSLAITTVDPDFTTDEARALAPRVEQLSEWTTRYTPGPLNYGGKNITIPTDEIDGTVVEPGETFDFLDVIGPITPERGYGYGAAIIRGRTRTGEDGALGGGMCSCSTTAFNAALRAGLETNARRNHSYYIERYPVGLDATVWIGSGNSRQTMSFTNDMQHAVLVRGINRTGRVIFQIWGVPDGRTVHLSEPEVTDRKKGIEKLQYTDNLAPGERKRVEYPITGFKATVVRTVRDADGNVIHRDTYFSNYRTIDGIVQVGRRPGDPEHGTKVPRGGGSDSSDEDE
jgi:vancomycin resistance protein YoaR